jgi:hypothetical protein
MVPAGRHRLPGEAFKPIHIQRALSNQAARPVPDTAEAPDTLTYESGASALFFFPAKPDSRGFSLQSVL